MYEGSEIWNNGPEADTVEFSVERLMNIDLSLLGFFSV